MNDQQREYAGKLAYQMFCNGSNAFRLRETFGFVPASWDELHITKKEQFRCLGVGMLEVELNNFPIHTLTTASNLTAGEDASITESVFTVYAEENPLLGRFDEVQPDADTPTITG